MAAKKSGLGRGLGALISDRQDAPVESIEEDRIHTVAIDRIQRNPFQPRRHFDPDALEELVYSIRQQGILQPLLVRPNGEDFELIAGERRLRAAAEAELREVPVIVCDKTDRESLEIALIENLLREDLNPLEEAQGYRDLMEKFELTQEQAAQRVGRSRAAVANSLRLLALPEPVQQMIGGGALSEGHAKLLCGLDIAEEQTLLARRVAAEGLSVRQLERLMKALRRAPRKPRAQKPDVPASHAVHIAETLQRRLGTPVRVTASKTLANGKKAAGKIEIEYYSNEELDRLLALLGVGDDL